MQAQATRTNVQSITAAQSLAAVQTMLRAGLGCITYLRDLLPEENFMQSHLVADEESLSYQGSDASFSSTSSKQSRTSGFKITTMTRGYSDEGDKILNYLESGIFDALQKEYLRSFIFAIYLDKNDPSKVPIMTLGDGLQKMNLKDKTRKGDNPITEAAKKGKAPTLLDVKKSVKLFYTDKAPANYEPPHFLAGDEEKDKWFFMTHDLDEIPDKWSIGKLDTGHHIVNLSVTSIATYLPSSTQNNNAAFGGTALRAPMPPNLTPIEEARLRAAQAEQQIVDAQERNVVWSGENAVELVDLDAVGDDDPDYVRLHDGSYKRVASDGSGNLVPSGIRNPETGNIDPLTGPMDIEEKHFGGVSETVPTRLDELNLDRVVERSNIEQTQAIEEFTQDVTLPPPTLKNHSPSSSLTTDSVFDSGHRKSSWASPAMSPITSAISSQGSDTDMEMLKDLQVETLIEDVEALGNGPHYQAMPSAHGALSDMETQMESIESYGQEVAHKATDLGKITPKRNHSRKPKSIADNGVELKMKVAFARVVVTGGITSGAWGTDKEFSCRFSLIPSLRRAIKTVEAHHFETLTEFAKANGGRLDLARQLFKRLEIEGFIIEQSTTLDDLDDLGFPQTRTRSLKGGRKTKGKQPKNRKNMQKPKYRFNREVLRSVQYSDYFNPDPNVEGRILKITELTSHLKSRPKAPNTDISKTAALHLAQIPLEGPESETQTQAETQMVPSDSGLKRRNPADDDGTPKAKKKIKISVTHGLDLAE
ncbi:HORMA domain-containing protein [Lyophyllum atratum]|nr:HORMA domain-containing protein [Lyophyllum atratum]